MTKSKLMYPAVLESITGEHLLRGHPVWRPTDLIWVMPAEEVK